MLEGLLRPIRDTRCFDLFEEQATTAASAIRALHDMISGHNAVLPDAVIAATLIRGTEWPKYDSFLGRLSKADVGDMSYALSSVLWQIRHAEIVVRGAEKGDWLAICLMSLSKSASKKINRAISLLRSLPTDINDFRILVNEVHQLDGDAEHLYGKLEEDVRAESDLDGLSALLANKLELYARLRLVTSSFNHVASLLERIEARSLL